MRLTDKLLPGLLVLILLSCNRGTQKQEPPDTLQGEPVSLELDLPDEDTQNITTEVKEKNVFTAIILKDDKLYCYSGKGLKSGDYYSLKDTTSFRNLLLKKKEERKEELVVIIKPSGDATYKSTVDILDEMSISQIKRYAMVKLSEAEASYLNVSVQKASTDRKVKAAKRLPADNAFLVVIKGDESVWYRILSAEHPDTILHKIKDPVTPNLAAILAKYKAEKTGININYLVKGDNNSHYPAFEKVINAFREHEITRYNLVNSEDEYISN